MTAFLKPANLTEALDFLADTPLGEKTLMMAGGTDLMVLVNSRALKPERVMDIWDLEELKHVELSENTLTLGALTTYSRIIEDPWCQRACPMLREAAMDIGAVQIQNRGTLGGNIANGSPAGDTLPVLAVYEAELELLSKNGSRRVPFNAFYTGYKKNQLKADELLYRIHIPVEKPTQRHNWRKMGTRRAQSISKVMMAALAEIHEGKLADIRIAFGSVAPTVIRAKHTENALRGKPVEEAAALAKTTIQQDISPINDVRSTARFRRQVSSNLLGRFLTNLL